jgi:ABC-type branched-subunit amino acid transport system substrate-binding protein
MKHTVIGRVAVGAGAVALAISACSTSSSTAAGSTGSTGSAGSTASAGSAGAATGTPINLEYIGAVTGPPPLFTEELVGVKAAAMAINRAGGINHHPVNIITCDTKDTPSGETTCAQGLASSGAVAVVGEGTIYTTAVDDETTKLQMANIGLSGGGSSDLAPTNTASFSLAVPGTAGLMCPSALADLGAAKIGVLGINASGVQLEVQAAQAGIKKIPGASYAGATLINFGDNDLAGPLQTAVSKGANGLVLGLTVDGAIAALRANAGRVKMCTAASVFTPADIKSLGSAANGLIELASVPPLDLLPKSGPLGQEFVSDENAYYASAHDSSANPAIINDLTTQGWMSVKAFQQVASKLPDVTQQSVYTSFSHTTDLNFPGLLPAPVNYAKTQPIPTLARLFIPEYAAYVWNAANQTWTATGKSYNVVSFLSGQG